MAIKGLVRDVSRPKAVSVERVPSGAVAPAELLTGEQFAAEIGRLWRDAQARFLDIGRRLNEAFGKLEHGEWGQLLESLPFERATADKLRKVAMAADAGAVPIDRLPPSYSTVYEVLTLTDTERAAADGAGLIRPDVKRAELIAFKRQLRAAEPKKDKRAELEARRARLLEEVARIDAELARMD